MSWTDIRPYFNQRLSAQGLAEWSDGFGFENIPDDILDGAFHVEFGEFAGEGQNQNHQVSGVTVTCRVFKKGYAGPQAAIDEAIQLAQTLVKDCVKPANRLTQSFKNVVFQSMNVQPLAESNDNSLIIVVVFRVTDVIDVLN
jgi:hypothetical protein